MQQLPEFYLDTEQLAHVLGLSESRIRQLTLSAALCRTEEGYECVEIIRSIWRYMESRTDIASIKKEKMIKEDKLLQVALNKAEGSVIPKADVDRAWADIILRIRDKFRRIGSKLAPRLPFCKSEVEMEKLINEEIDEVLTELSRPPDYEKPAH